MISSSFAGLRFFVMGWQLVVESPYHCCCFLKASHTSREHQHRIRLLFSDISVCGSAYVCICIQKFQYLDHHFYFIFIISSCFPASLSCFFCFCSKIKMFLVFIRIFWCSIPAFCFSSLSSLWSVFDEHRVIFCYLVQTKLSFTFILFCLERSV